MHKNDFKSKIGSALVTGASGFIGSALVKRLKELGSEVTAVAREKNAGLDPDVRWSFGDLARRDYCRQLFEESKPDVIFHLASHVSGTRDAKMVLPIFDANLGAAVNILALSQEMGCRRLILTGSMEEPDEGNAIPQSPYAAAKWAASGYARMYHALYDTPVVVARLFMVYGPDQKDTTKLIPYVIRSFLNDNAPRLSSGVREVDWIYIDDVIDAYISLALAQDDINGKSIDIGSGELVSIRGIVEEIQSLIGARSEPSWGSLDDRPMEISCIADVPATKRLIGWEPKTPIREGLKATIEWYRQGNYSASSSH